MDVVRTSLLRMARGFDLGAKVCASVAASTLNIGDLRGDTEQKWGRFYTTDTDIDKGLFPWETFLVDRFVRGGDRILLVGCGTGRDLIPLAARGHEVTGVDPASHAVEIGRAACARRNVAADIVDGYFEDVEIAGLFDVVMFSNLCYGLVPESTRRIASLVKARALLTSGGRILLSYVGNTPRPYSRLIELMKVLSKLRGSDWHPEQGDVLHPMPNGRPRFHYEHLFVHGELASEAKAAGLRVAFHDDTTFDYWLAMLAP